MRKEYKALYEKFGLNVVYYRKRKKLTQLSLQSWWILIAVISVLLNWEMWVFPLMLFSKCVRYWTYRQKTCLTFVTEQIKKSTVGCSFLLFGFRILKAELYILFHELTSL